jgi:hypothetical protein
MSSDEEQPVLKIKEKKKTTKKPPRIYKVKDLDGDERFKDIHPHLPSWSELLYFSWSH